jgi:hypothetical protein
MLQTARASLSVVLQRSKCKDVFFTSATIVHFQKLPGISFLLACHNDFRNIFSDSLVPNKPTVSHLLSRFRDTNSSLGGIKYQEKVNACIAERGGNFQNLIQ